MRSENETERRKKSPLSPYWAFVVRLWVGIEVMAGRMTEQVEHVVLGQVADLDSLQELLTFMVRVLTTIGAQGALRHSLPFLAHADTASAV